MKTVSLAVVLALAVPAVPLAAQACGMEESYMPSRPADLYVFALDEIENGSYGTAQTAARRIVNHTKATKEQKAKAWTVIAWIRWANGQKKQSREALGNAKALDGEAIVAVLGKIKAAEKNVTEALRDEASKVEVAVAEK